MSGAHFRGPSSGDRSFGLIVAGSEGFLGDFISRGNTKEEERRSSS